MEKNISDKLKSLVFEFVYPDKCMFCGELTGGGYLCAACRAKLEPIESPCPRCAAPMKNGVCEDCPRGSFLFERSAAYTLYSDDVREMIHLMKYSGKSETARKLAELMNDELDLSVFAWYDVIVAVPLSKKRERERGYNQAEIFADRLGKLIGIEALPNALKRVKDTEAQHSMSAAQRRENVKGAFSANARLVREKNILLADDIFTTGSTFNECAKTLINAGAKSIACVSFARTKHNDWN